MCRQNGTASVGNSKIVAGSQVLPKRYAVVEPDLDSSDSECEHNSGDNMRSLWRGTPEVLPRAFNCTGSNCPKHLLVDEGEGSDGSDTEDEDARSALRTTEGGRCWSGAPKVLPSLASVVRQSRTKDDSAPRFAPPCRRSSGEPSLGASTTIRLPPPEAAPRSAKGLVAYLRSENQRLQAALQVIDHEIKETAGRVQANGGCASKDVFSNLLALAREFGEGGGDDEADEATGAISIATPRGGSCDTIEVEEATLLPRPVRPEAERLRESLAASRKEIAHLRNAVDAVDAELQCARARTAALAA